MCFRDRRRWGAPGLELEVDQQVVREGHELLPGAVGRVGLGRDAVERQPTLELRDGLFMVPAPAREEPEIPYRQVQGARHRRVFVVPVVRIKQVQLIVLGGPVVDFLPIDGHGHGDLPRRDRARDGETGHVGRDRDPGRFGADVLLQIQPAIERDFDGIADPARLQPPQHILAEKRPIHAEPQPAPARAQRRELRPQVTQKRQPRLPVVDVARPVLHPQDVRGLGHVRHDRVVAGHLPVMRVEAAKRSLDLQPGRHHHAVDIDRPRAQPQPGQQVAHHGRVEGLQAAAGRHREVRQPPTHGPRRRHDAYAREALEDRVVRHVGQVAQAPAADNHQPDEHPHHRDHAEVAPPRHAGKRVAHQTIEASRAQVAPEQFQPGIRREHDVREFQGKISVDTGRQISFSSSHVSWPFVAGMRSWFAPSSKPQRKAFFNFKVAFDARRMTHWG